MRSTCDNYYFNDSLEEMTGAIPVPPTLSVKQENKEILRRIVVKGILQKAFNNENIYPSLDKIPNDTHGEFGSVSKWIDNKNEITDWIQNNEEIIKNVIKGCTVGLHFDIKTELTDWIQNDLIGSIDKAVEKSNNEGLAETLANEGLLPLFGMPYVVRNFYHGRDDNKLLSIDRPIEMAISEFAPGSIKTKDKAEYEVSGITVPMLYQGTNHPFDKMNTSPLKDCFSINETTMGYEVNQWKDKDRMLIIPRAFRTKDSGLNSQVPENNDVKTSFSKLTTIALPQPFEKKLLKNSMITFSESTNNNEAPVIWKINDNKGKDFTLYKLNEQYNLISYIKDHIPNETTTKIKIALGAKKITDILGISINVVPDGINLKLTGNIFRDTAIKASHYSAAFILQRVLASELDIDPTEIEIPEIKEKDGILQIILCDTLPNGSGFIRYLKDNFEAILKKIIEKDGFVATEG